MAKKAETYVQSFFQEALIKVRSKPDIRRIEWDPNAQRREWLNFYIRKPRLKSSFNIWLKSWNFCWSLLGQSRLKICLNYDLWWYGMVTIKRIFYKSNRRICTEDLKIYSPKYSTKLSGYFVFDTLKLIWLVVWVLLLRWAMCSLGLLFLMILSAKDQ